MTKTDDSRGAETLGPGWELFSILVLLGILVAGVRYLLAWEPRSLPIRVIRLEGELGHLALPQLQEAVGRRIAGGILTQDLGVIRAAVEGFAWVETAWVRRVWPDRLVIRVRERKPIAYWGEEALVTAEGVLFRPETGGRPPGLPQLRGQDARAAQLAERLLAWQPRFSERGLSLIGITCTARGAWILRTGEGFSVYLGTNAVDARLHRFLMAYPQLAAAGRPARVDARYTNGLAVRWQTQETH